MINQNCYRLSIYRGYICYDSVCRTIMIKLRSDLHSRTTPHNSSLRASYEVSFARITQKLPPYIENAFHVTLPDIEGRVAVVHKIHHCRVGHWPLEVVGHRSRGNWSRCPRWAGRVQKVPSGEAPLLSPASHHPLHSLPLHRSSTLLLYTPSPYTTHPRATIGRYPTRAISHTAHMIYVNITALISLLLWHE